MTLNRQQAHATVLVSCADTPADTAARLCDALRGEPDVVIDCCGFEASMQSALIACARCGSLGLSSLLSKHHGLMRHRRHARRGGRVVLVGMGAQRMTLNLAAAAAREVDLVGSFRYGLLLSPVHARAARMPLLTQLFIRRCSWQQQTHTRCA